jgi:hypothetical protein
MLKTNFSVKKVVEQVLDPSIGPIFSARLFSQLAASPTTNNYFPGGVVGIGEVVGATGNPYSDG